MGRECDLTGKGRLVGNKVSHANNKTKTVSNANLQWKKVFDPESGKTVRLRVSTRTIKSLDKIGGLSKMIRKQLKRGH